ncbi:WD40 repeat-containing protein [Thecamonas trahens ATCC 50062]|uniref:WD40 repeat-containing protein n=1 Tax=Thecamonas trahens ATCC 50062 TaxID=461836 RepID=A0A0L0DHW8_THETB|nr:WD40 repeat-containing protein [Thecamonas trahens ATCC 50062]KNC51964.1 WD40 repeat-containing protein [Thecamonas trahens ATCC 50062]|eukprot:XP_013755551.1 WD40 repeat-containing protein [Thecamonas trahens ATCC 50062]
MSFNREGTAFATTSTDSRIRVWDTRSGELLHVLTDADHLSTNYTCLTWLDVPASFGLGPKKTSKRKRGGSKSKESEGEGGEETRAVLAVGTRKGTLLVWDVATEKIISRAGSRGGHSAALRALVARPDGLFSAGSDGQVLFWSWKTLTSDATPVIVADGTILGAFSAATFHTISALAASESGSRLAVAANSICVLDVSDLDNVTCVATLTGHASLVSSLAFSADGAILISAALHDRFINVYDLSSTSRDTVFSPDAARILVTESQPLGLVTYATDAPSSGKSSKKSRKSASEPGAVHVAAFTASGEAAIWSDVMATVDAGGKKKKSRKAAARGIKPRAPACLVAEEPTDDNGFVGRGIRALRPTTAHAFLAMHGPTKNPSFTAIKAAGTDGSVLESVTIAAPAAASQHPFGGPGTSAGASAVGVPSKAKGTNAKVLSAADAMAPRAGEAPMAMSLAAGGFDSLSDGEDDGEENKNLGGLSFAERLKAINGSSGGRQKNGRRSRASGDGSASPASDDGTVGVPRGESLKRMLVQALHSGDNQLLEYCLGMSTHGTIMATVRQLPTARIVALLKILTDKLRSRPARGTRLVPWIRAILVTHTAFLLSVPGLSAMLTPLYQTFEERLAVYDKLMKLNGRLDLVLSQVSADDAAPGRTSVRARPRTLYIEGNDDTDLLGSDSDSSDSSDPSDSDSDLSDSDSGSASMSE